MYMYIWKGWKQGRVPILSTHVCMHLDDQPQTLDHTWNEGMLAEMNPIGSGVQLILTQLGRSVKYHDMFYCVSFILLKLSFLGNEHSTHITLPKFFAREKDIWKIRNSDVCSWTLMKMVQTPPFSVYTYHNPNIVYRLWFSIPYSKFVYTYDYNLWINPYYITDWRPSPWMWKSAMFLPWPTYAPACP